jgi:methionine biosynthesis protein MetW
MSKTSDNRNYVYSNDSQTKRSEFQVIENIVGRNKRVIDLGCGDGSLIQILIKNGNTCRGMEITKSGVEACRKKGLKVIEGRIDEKLPFKDKSFDFAVCNVTLHMVMYPETLLREMKRISKKQIITFPNFAFVLNRIELLFFGVFPGWSLFGYQWYSTGHIHQLSIKDFENFCKTNRIAITGRHHLFPKIRWNYIWKSPMIGMVAARLSNLFATMAVFVTK